MQGGWVPLVVGPTLSFLMSTWHRGRVALHEQLGRDTGPTGGAHADVEIQVALAHENRWTNLIGGLPIRVDGFILGAVAAGSGNGRQDLAVARAGAAAIPGAGMCLDFIAMGAEESRMIGGRLPPGIA